MAAKAATKSPASTAGVKSALRVFEVLELFDELRQPLTVSDVARELGYPVSSALMLLRCMNDMGYLSLDSQRKVYCPTPRLSRVTSWVDYSAVGIAHLNDMLLDISRLTGETIVLAAEQDLDAVFLRIIRSAKPLSLSVDVGGRARLESSAIGCAILAPKEDDELQRFFARLDTLPDRRLSRRERKALEQRVADCRERGVAIGFGLMSPDIGAIAAPLPRGDINVQYVVSVGGPADRIAENQDTLIDALQRVLETAVDAT